jgi:hypothetical protein
VTNLAEHLEESISHDQINRYLIREKLTPRLVWEQVKLLIQSDENAYIIFDDTVLDKRYSEEIELTRRQYSGNEHGILRGIGLVSCVYVNSKTGQFWVIVSTGKTEYVATNDLNQDSTDVVQQGCDIRSLD